MPNGGKPRRGWKRRLAGLACALGLLFALPASAGASEVIDVPATPVFLAGNTGAANCQAFVYIQWPEQANAEGWELDYEYLKGTADILTHANLTLSPPFDDERGAARGWLPPAGTHWYYHTYYAKSAPGRTVECASLEAEMLARVITATVHVTVPGPSERDATCRGKAATIFAEPGSPTDGTSHRDVIVGTPERDVIRAGGGNDLVCGLGGNDIILGGGGRDVLLGQGGGDAIRGQGDKDVLYGGGGADHLFGQAAADRLFGQAGADALNGGAGRPDLCNGGSGRDRRQSPGCERRQLIP